MSNDAAVAYSWRSPNGEEWRIVAQKTAGHSNVMTYRLETTDGKDALGHFRWVDRGFIRPVDAGVTPHFALGEADGFQDDVIEALFRQLVRVIAVESTAR